MMVSLEMRGRPSVSKTRSSSKVEDVAEEDESGETLYEGCSCSQGRQSTVAIVVG